MVSNLVITKDNQLIQNSGYELSLSEQRVLLLCIAKLDSRQKITDKDTFTLSVTEFNAEIGITKDTLYHSLEAAVNRLYQRDIYLDNDDQKLRMRWLYKQYHCKHTGEITISFTPEILPYLTELKSRFTSYKFKDVAKFESSYSFRFYELLASWKDKCELKIEVGWIRDALQLGDKYQDIYNLKRNIITPAITDINNHSDLKVTLQQVKRGKVITHFIFKYLAKNPRPKSITQAYILKNAKPGESWKEAHARLSKVDKAQA